MNIERLPSNKNRSGGFSMLEVIVSAAVLALSIWMWINIGVLAKKNFHQVEARWIADGVANSVVNTLITMPHDEFLTLINQNINVLGSFQGSGSSGYQWLDDWEKKLSYIEKVTVKICLMRPDFSCIVKQSDLPTNGDDLASLNKKIMVELQYRRDVKDGLIPYSLEKWVAGR